MKVNAIKKSTVSYFKVSANGLYDYTATTFAFIRNLQNQQYFLILLLCPVH